MRPLLLALFAVSGAVHAITLDELLAKNLAARGGAANVQKLKTLRLTGRADLSGQGRRGSTIEAAWAQVQTRSGKFRSEVTRQGLTAVQAWNGKEGWKLSPFRGRREPERASQDDARTLAQDADLEGQLINWREKGSKVDYLGVEDVDGTPAHKLRVALKDGDVQYVFLDPDAFLEIRIVNERRVRGSEQVTEADLGAYGQIAGVWIPTSISQGRKGAPRNAHFTVEKAEANVPIEDRIFEYPQGTIVREIVTGPQASPPSFEAPPLPAPRVSFDEGVISGLGVRNIGSATMSGRVSALAAANVDGKTLVYVGAASGGVWKSQDGGTRFRPVFDKQPVQSIGAITIDPREPRTVWVGTGETWTRNSVSIGDGIYRSTDGGETWTHMGLPESERIARILVHPKSSSLVYACVTGKLWSDSKERGVYRTTDGGKTWALILSYAGNASTGCSSLTMDPQNPDVLFAGTWDFRRKGWTFRSGGDGPKAPSGSALLRTADGGKTWKTVEGNGLPPPPWGRVEVVIAPSSAKRVYAVIESQHSALYRSDDGGSTWTALDRSQSMVWRPFYFARLVVDPTNPDRVFKTNLNLIVSEDGGRSFSDTSGGAHGDWHDLWIDPQNPKHVIGGDDGGLWQSFDGGNRWWKQENLPISQFYHVAVDGADPYHVYGGLQDNSTWIGDSAYGGGISNRRWENLYGGDGFWAVPDTSDPEAVYVESQGGFIGRVDRRTMSSRDIQPKAGYKEKLRFNWNAPIAASPTNKGVVYIGAQFLFRSKDRGDTWERISPDLTTNDPQKQRQEESGGITVDNSSAESHTTITVISESPRDPNVIWVGTDDGNVQLTRDGGAHWTNVVGNVAGLPKASWVSWVEASRFDAGTAYAAFDRHMDGDMTPWVYRTQDFGKTWTRIAGPQGPVRGYAHVIKEDTVRKDLLFLGTELGLFISVDAGKAWAEFRGGNFPRVAVRDLAIHPRDGDLVLGTHGRGIWIVDDLSPLRALSLFHEAGVPREVLPVVQGADEVGAALVRAPVDMIGFVGSQAAGSSIAAQAGRDLKRVALELGGKDPMIVLGDADLEAASAGAVRGAFKNCGQVCCSIERIYVDRSLYGRLLEAIVERTRRMRIGPGLEESSDVGPMVTGESRGRVLGLLDEARRAGARVLAGGNPREGKGFFVEPAVVVDPPSSARLVREETFGPVLTVEPFDTEEEAVERANALPYGLTASVWSQDVERAAALARRLDAGTRAVNQNVGSIVQMPWGGRKRSGIGRMLSVEGIREFAEPVTLRLPAP